LADDATAAVTNPAGLVSLSKPEISVEVRGKRVETRFLKGGRLSGIVSNRGIDTIAGPVHATTVDANVLPAYASVIYPRGNFAIGGYRHQFVKVDQQFERDGVLGLFTTPDGVRQDAREPPQRVAREVGIASYGVAIAYEFADRFSVGAGLSLSKFSFHEVSTRFATIGIDLISSDPVHPSVYGQPDFSRVASGGFSSSRQALSPRVEADDVAAAVNAGFTFKISPAVTVGAVFRQGPSFAFKVILPDQSSSTGTFAVPDKFTVGFAIHPKDVLTISVDLSRVQYSSLKRNFVDLIVGADGQPSQFVIEDGTELHSGIEYVFGSKLSPALRFGAWYDPAHGIRFERSNLINPFFSDLFSAALSGGQDLVHYTGGAGLSLNRHLEMNVAGDFTTRNRLVSASAIVRF